MPNPEKSFTKVDVPADGSCLFWAVTLAYLTPVKNEDALFRQRYETLFGNEETAIQNLNHIRNLVQNYNTYDDTFIDLVRNTFRNRVVDHIHSRENEFRVFVEGESGRSFDDYLQDMRNPNTWGGEPEIRAMSEMLGADISVSGASNTRYANGDVQIQLFHVGTSGVRNHYNFGLEQHIVNDNEVGRLQNSLKESIKHYQTGPQDFELVQLLIQEVDSLKASTSTQQREDFEARFQSYIDQIPSYLHSVKKSGFFSHFFFGSFSTLLDTEIAEKLNIKRIYFSFNTSKTLKIAVVKNGQIGSVENAINNIDLFSISEGKRGHEFTSGELENILKENIASEGLTEQDIENKIEEIKNEIKGIMKSMLVKISKGKEGIFANMEPKGILDSDTSQEFHEIEKGLWDNPEGNILQLSSSKKEDVKRSLGKVLNAINIVHSKYEDSLQYGSGAREAAHHGFIAGALNNFRYRHNLRVYLEQFAGRGYTDIVLLARGPNRALNSIPIIIELKAGDGPNLTPDKALEQAEKYAQGFQPNVQRVLTTSGDILCVGVNLDYSSPISNIEAKSREGRIIPLFQDMLESVDDWHKGTEDVGKGELKKRIKDNLERIYHTFPGTPEKGDNHYFSRFLLGQSLLLNEVEDLGTKFEKHVFIYDRGENIPTEVHPDTGRPQRPAAQAARAKLSEGLDPSHAVVSMVLIPESTEKLVYVINIVEANRKDVLDKNLPLDRLSQKIGDREIVELNLNFDTRYKLNFKRYLTVEASDPVSLEQYNEEGVDEFQGTFRKVPYPDQLKETFDRALNSQLTSSQLSSIVDEYKELSRKIGGGIWPFKTLIGKENDFQGVLNGAFSYYSDLKLQESPETRSLVLTEFQTGRGERIDMLVHGIKFADQDNNAKEYTPIGLELKLSRQGKGAALLKKAEGQINEEYKKGVTYKTLTDGDEVKFIGVVLDKGAKGGDSLILTSEKSIPVKVVHSSTHVLPTVDRLDLNSCLEQGNRKKRSTNGCLFSWDDVDKFNSAKDSDKRDRDKIKINDDKFLTYIKDSQDEGKNAQLVEFIGEKITPNVEGNHKYLLSEVVRDGGYVNYAQNRRIKDLQSDVLQQNDGLTKSPKLKSRLMNAAGRIQLIRGIHGAIVSCTDGTATDCGLNLGGMAWSFASQPIENVMVKVTPKVVASAEKVVGKVIPGTLGKQTKFAIRVVGVKFGTTVAKGVAGALTGVFDIVDIGMSASNLVDCKNRENGDNPCGGKEIRDSIASISFSAASFVSGVALTAASMPGVGILVGLGLMVGHGVYSGISNIIEYEKKYDTTHDENWRIFWHTFAFQPMPLDVQHLADRHNIVNSLAQEVWKALSNSSSIVAYGIGLGKVSNNALHPSNAKIIMDRDNADTTSLSRVIPDSIPNAKMICLPHITDADYEKGWKKSVPTAVHYCENAMVIADIRKSMQSGKTIVYDLRNVDSGHVVGSNKLDNNFMIFQGNEKVIGGDNTVNRFAFVNSSFTGEIIVGSNSTNVFDFSVVKDYIMKINIDYNLLESNKSEMLCSGALQIKINDRSLINECVSNSVNIPGYHYIGRQNKVDEILCTGNSEGLISHDIMVNSGGGYSSAEGDVIENCSRVMVLPYTDIKGKEGNYIFYVKTVEYKGEDLHSEIDVRGTGTVVFPETDLLSGCGEITYSSSNNTLSLKIKLDQDSQYVLDIKNYIEQGSGKPNFILIDKNGSNIVPKIRGLGLSTAKINLFELHTEYSLDDFDALENHYKKVLKNNKDYEVFGVVRDKVQDQKNGTVSHMIFGSSGDDIINFDQGAMFARGGKGHDTYVIGGGIGDRKVIIDNNSDDEKLDLLSISEVPEEFSIQQRNLHLNYGDTHIQVKNYLQDNSYRHLMVMNSKGETFIPYVQSILHTDSSSVDNGKLVPFFHATQTQNMFLLPKDFQDDRVVIDSRLEDIEQYRDKDDLLLTRESGVPFILKVEGYYGDREWRNVDFILWNNGNFSYFDLPQEADEIMNYQDKLKADYERIVKEYVIDFTQSVSIAHNQNDDLTSVGQDEERVGLIILEGIAPGQVKVSSSGSDLVFRDTGSNHTINIKNWDSSESHRISILEFDLGLDPIKIRRLNRFSLSSVAEIQTLIDKASKNYQNKAAGTEMENDFKCLVSVNGFENENKTYECLGFSSLQEQINFTKNFCSLEQIKEFKDKIPNDNQVISLLKKLQNSLVLNGHDQDTIDQCFKLTLDSEPEILKLFISETAQDGEWDEVKVLLDKTANRSNADVESKNKWSENWTLLHYAVYNGNLNLVNGVFDLLLGRVGDINAKDKWNWTPLHYAAYYNEPDIFALLIDKGANIEIESNYGQTPLEVANTYVKSEVSTFINKAIEKDKSDVVKNFFKKSAERLSVEDRDELRTNWTLLHYAAYNGNSGIVQGSFGLLLEKSGGDINVKENQYDYTPLQYAVYYNRPEIVKLFLNNGADIEAKDKDHKTPLHLAAKEGYMDIINLLLDNGANVEAKDQYDRTPFQYAESESRSNVVQLFKDRYANSGENKCKPIHYAAHNDRLDLINILLNKGDDIEAKDKDGKTPLHYAARRGYTASISLLLSKGAKINAITYSSDWSWTPLHYAVHYNKLDAVKYLVDKHANVNAKDKYGKTPLHYAAQRGCIASISLLLDGGAGINTTAAVDWNWAPLHYAAYHNKAEAVKYLTSKGANVNAKDDNGNTPAYYAVGGHRVFDTRSKRSVSVQEDRLDVLESLMNKTNIEIKNNDDQTLFHVAAKEGNLRAVRVLMNKVVDISSEIGQVEKLRSFVSEKDKFGYTPLQYAAKEGKWGVVNLFLDKTSNKMGMLFRSNGDQSSVNWTTLHYAAVYSGDLNLVEDVLELLPNQETIVNSRDGQGWTPLHYAVYYNRPKIVAFLVCINANIDAETSTGKTVFQMIDNNESEVAKILFISHAINKSELDEAKLLLSQHAPRSNVEIREKNKYSGTWTFLHYAVYSNNVDLFGDLFQLFLNESDDNIDAKDERGWTPLHYAAYYGERDMIDFLISKEAEVDARDNSRNTPLHIAAKEGNYDSVRVLLEEGADINAENLRDKTPLDLAKRYRRDRSEVVDLLADYKGRGKGNERGTNHIRHKRHEQHHRRHLQERKQGGATSGASKPSSWINDLFGWVKDYVGGLFGSKGTLPGKSGNFTVQSLPNISQHNETAKGSSPSSFLSVENVALIGCIAEALDNTLSKRYQALKSQGVNFIPSTQTAVNFARRKFDSFVEDKIRNLDSKEKARIRTEVKNVYPEIIESFRRGIEFSGNVGLDDVLEKCKRCFCTNMLPNNVSQSESQMLGKTDDKPETRLSDVTVNNQQITGHTK